MWYHQLIDIRDTYMNGLLKFGDEFQEDGNRQREHMAQKCPHLNVRNFRVQQ